MNIFKKVTTFLLLFVTIFFVSSRCTLANNSSTEEDSKPSIYGLTAVVRNCENVNLRKEPTSSSKLLTTIPKGTEFTVLEQSGKWFQVKYNNFTGYIFWKYLQFVEPEVDEENPSKIVGNSIIHYTSSENRDVNISIACSTINGTILQPGETFYWSKVVGKATKEKGYLSAPVIVNRKPTLGLGGGVCQVSTTLYNAILDTSLKVNERHHHSIGCAYAKQDATVAYGSKDFVFTNTYDFPILIEAYSYKATVFVNIHILSEKS